MPVAAELVELVSCPRCRGRLVLRAAGDGLECGQCKVVYPVIDDIPVLLIDEARPLPR